MINSLAARSTTGDGPRRRRVLTLRFAHTHSQRATEAGGGRRGAAHTRCRAHLVQFHLLGACCTSILTEWRPAHARLSNARTCRQSFRARLRIATAKLAAGHHHMAKVSPGLNCAPGCLLHVGRLRMARTTCSQSECRRDGKRGCRYVGQVELDAMGGARPPAAALRGGSAA